MSFDIHFQPCRFDGTTSRQTNPFTGEPCDVANSGTLTDAEVKAVVRVLEAAGAKRDADGSFVLRASDGTSFELFGDLASGCMLAVRGAGITPSLAKLLFEVLVAGDWVLVSDPAVIAASATALRGMPENDDTFDDVVIVTSPEQVKTLLLEGWKAFETYAAKVVS